MLESMKPWRRIAWGVALIALGLALWYTAFVAAPVGVVLVAVGLVKAMKERSRAKAPA
jgi:hypothetical protein